MITDINAIGEVTLDSQDTIEAIEAAYGQLTDEEKAQVSNYNTLVEAKAALEVLLASKAKVDTVIEAISAIGTVSKDSGTAISNAENLYNALSDEEKAQVSNYNTLVEAKAALEAILESEEKVTNVIEAINAIGTVNKDSGTAISNAENLYNALSDEEKALVTNHDVLVEARETWNELTKPSTGTSASTGTETSTGETKPEKKGCRGSILSTSILVSAFAIGGVILSLKKKKEEQ